VTNLYSSAVFIAGRVAICVVLESIFRNAVASAAAAAVAVPSLVIAHFLAGDGDTMRMLQAVLDTNIWLATHVLAITIATPPHSFRHSGDCVCHRAALLRGHRSARRSAASENLRRMIYGVVCFAMLFSFVGTILGGIWADQSWGRSGLGSKGERRRPDVLWNAIILHARWGGLVRERGSRCWPSSAMS